MLSRLLLGLWLGCSSLFAQRLPPAPTAHVTDPQAFLSPSAQIALAKDLEALEQDAPCQAIIWIGKLPPGTTLEDFSARAFKAWGIGHRDAKDGVAIFVFPASHKLRIEVGYGLEDRLTDLQCGRILRDDVSPRLQQGDREGALRAAVAGLRIALVKASPARPPTPSAAPEASSITPLEGLLLIIAIIVGFILLVKLLQWLTSGPATYSSRGRSSTWWDSSGSSSSSNSSSGSWFDSSSSSSGGSSFTDFFSGGGGDSGGGGASGDW